MSEQGNNLSGLNGSGQLTSFTSPLNSYAGNIGGKINAGRNNSSGGGISSNISDISVDLTDYTTSELTDPKDLPKGNWANDLISSPFMKVANTCGLFLLSANDGAVRLTEKIVDGAIWSTKETFKIGMIPSVWFTSLFDKELAEKMSQENEEIDDFFKSVIVFEADDWLKQLLLNCRGIQLQNENSFFRYDGPEAETVTDYSEKIQKFVGAAISSKVWGGALAILLGGCYGSGEQAEYLYKTKQETGWLDEVSILFHGIEEAIRWWSTAQIFKGVGGKTLSSGQTVGEAAKEFGTEALKHPIGINKTAVTAILEAFKSGKVNPFSSGFVEFISNGVNITRVNNSIMGNVDDYFSGERKLNIVNIIKDLNSGFGTAMVGGSRFNVIGSANDYTVTPVQGVLFLLNPGEAINWVLDRVFPEETAPVDISSSDDTLDGGGGGGQSFGEPKTDDNHIDLGSLSNPTDLEPIDINYMK